MVEEGASSERQGTVVSFFLRSCSRIWQSEYWRGQCFNWGLTLRSGVQRSGDARGDCLIVCPLLPILVLSSGIWWSLLLDICNLWGHNMTSYSRLQTNVLAKFVDTNWILFYTHSPCSFLYNVSLWWTIEYCAGCGYPHLRGGCGNPQRYAWGCGLNLVRGGRGIKFDFVPVAECWLNACESDTIKKKVSLSYFTDLDFLSFWNESLNKLPLAMKHVAWVFSGFPWQVQIWEGLRGGCRLEVCGCGSGQDFLNSCGCGAALKFASAGRERTKNFNPRRTL